jgi:glycosyltransferase involved in cell wall biosynthesis
MITGSLGQSFFEEPTRSYLLNVSYQKRASAALTTTIATISQAVKDETLNKDALVVRLANSHLPAWSETFRPQRERFRAARGWDDAFVVLTVCRFYENERAYKGLDKIAMILREFPYLYPDLSKPLLWVLAGAGAPADVRQVEQMGFTVFPNVTDEILADLYRAADAYTGFSKWEGYNLGISQALAMGLPTLGSDIPAHREFPIVTTNSTLAACEWVAKQMELRIAARPERTPTVYEWEHSTAAFAKVVADTLKLRAEQPARLGASGRIWADLANRPDHAES